MKSFRSLILMLLSVLLLSTMLNAQGLMSIGVRIQKTPNLYYENGLALDYHSSELWKNRIHLGASYTSSRLGSALGSNALKQDNILLSTGLKFRQGKTIMPIVGFNLGYFMVDTEFEIFSMLPNSSLLLSTEFGVGIDIYESVSFQTTVGYNLITGDGVDGPGTLYPIFLNFTTLYELGGVEK